MTSALFFIPGLTSLLAGLGIVYRSWRARHARKSTSATALAFGWAAILLGVVCFSQLAGEAWGVAIAVLGIALSVPVVLLTGRDWTPLVPKNRPSTSVIETQPGRSWRLPVVILLSGPISLLIAAMGMLAGHRLAYALGASAADQLALALFLLPLCWTGLAVISVIKLALWRRALILAGSGLVFGTSFFFLTVI